MEDYDITTLPDGYEPLVPSSTSDFKVFIVFCCVAILCLSGYGLYNWLETGNIMGKKTLVAEAPVERPRTGTLGGPWKMPTPLPVYEETFELRTKDAVLVSVKVRTDKKLTFEQKADLRVIMGDFFYKEIPQKRGKIQAWADKYGISSMTLKSKTPLTKEPEIPEGSLREDIIKEGLGGTDD